MTSLILEDLLAPSLCSVSCSAATTDQFPAENLAMKKGFMVEGFVKPPVRLDFTFHTPVHLVAMVINPQLGSHCTQVMVALVLRNHPQQQGHSGNNDSERSQNGLDSPQFIDKLVVPSPGDGWHCRFNGNFASKEVLKMIEAREPGLKIDPRNCVGISAHPRHLYHVKVLRIEILKAFASRVPSLGGLRVFGMLPGKPSIPPPLSLPLLPLPAAQKQVPEPIIKPPPNPPPYSRSSSSSAFPEVPLDWRPPQAKVETEEEIDPSFIDPITFNLMVDPIILPSGHVVDRQTLMKHLGNSSTNPFTGLKMTARDVVPNTPLKARIDSFMLSQGSQARKSPGRMIPFSGEARTLTGSFPRSQNSYLGDGNDNEVSDKRGGKRLKLDQSPDNCSLCRKDLEVGVSMVVKVPGCDHQACRPCFLGAISQSEGPLRCPICSQTFQWGDVIATRFQ